MIIQNSKSDWLFGELHDIIFDECAAMQAWRTDKWNMMKFYKDAHYRVEVNISSAARDVKRDGYLRIEAFRYIAQLYIYYKPNWHSRTRRIYSMYNNIEHFVSVFADELLQLIPILKKEFEERQFNRDYETKALEIKSTEELERIRVCEYVKAYKEV